MKYAEIEWLENMLAHLAIADEALVVAGVRARHRGEAEILAEIRSARAELGPAKFALMKRRWRECPDTLTRMLAREQAREAAGPAVSEESGLYAVEDRSVNPWKKSG